MAGDSATRKPRASVQRVRTGCITCKIRRIKCDEQRPSCLKCKHTGRKCDGYNLRRTRRNDFSFVQPASQSPQSPRVPAASLIYRIPFKIPGSQSDRQLLHFYCTYAYSELSEYPATTFWTKTLLQWSDQEPVVRRSLIALSCTHQQLWAPQGTAFVDSDNLELAYIREYNKAVRQLRKYLALTDHPCQSVVLMCCQILYCVACAMGRYVDARTHMQAGWDILRPWIAQRGKPSSPNPLAHSEDIMGCLWQLFSQMYLQATMFDETPSLSQMVIRDDDMAQYGPWLPDQFQTILEAQLTLEKIQNRLFRFLLSNNKYRWLSIDKLPSTVTTKKKELEEQLACWRSSFDRIMQQTSKACLEVAKLVRNHTLLLAIKHRAMSILLQDSIQVQRVASCNLDTNFIEICSWLKSNFTVVTTDADGIDTRTRFRFKRDDVPRVYLQLAKFRDRDLQSRVLSLLTQSQPCEGHSDGNIAVQMAKLLMDLGEKEIALGLTYGS